jgi:hypothetical protein
MIDMIDFTSSSGISYIQKDISIARIVSPLKNEIPDKIPVSVKLLNLSPDTIKGFNLAYTINKGLPVNQHFNETLIPFSDSVIVTFSRPADLYNLGFNDIMVYGVDNDDDFLQNDTLMVITEINDPISVSPNPFTSELNIIIITDTASRAHISMISSLGQKVIDFERKLIQGSNLIQINDPGLSPSVYFLRIEFKDLRRIIKVIKQK